MDLAKDNEDLKKEIELYQGLLRWSVRGSRGEITQEKYAELEAMWREERAKVRELETRLLDIKRMAER